MFLLLWCRARHGWVLYSGITEVTPKPAELIWKPCRKMDRTWHSEVVRRGLHFLVCCHGSQNPAVLPAKCPPSSLSPNRVSILPVLRLSDFPVSDSIDLIERGRLIISTYFLITSCVCSCVYTCTYVHIGIEVRSQSWMSFHITLCFWDRVSLAWNLLIFPGICWPPLLQCQICKHVTTLSLFLMGSGGELRQVLCLQGTDFIDWAISLSLFLHFFSGTDLRP